MDESYQLIIVGGGPAGLSAGLYAARSRLHSLLIERALVGGQIVNAETVENYPGFPEGISGVDLVSLMEKQALKYGLETAIAEVQRLEIRGDERILVTSEGEYRARVIIIAGGAEHSKLGVPGEEELRGKGVSYCATCDGAFFRDRAVGVVGGGNVALNDALFLTRFASKVSVIHRRDELRATRVLQEKAFAQPGIEFVWDTVVEAIEGDSQVRQVRLRNVKTGEKSGMEVGGVFIAVGVRPNTGYLQGVLDLTPEGAIKVNERMETGIAGVFAAGDIRAGSPRQVVCAAGDGAAAVMSAERYLSTA